MSNKKFLLIVNPVSGRHKGMSIVKSILPIFQSAEIDLTIEPTQFNDHAFQIAQRQKLESYQAICIAGGDGTIHNVINGMLARDDGIELPIGLIPAGTGNSSARDLNFQSPEDAANAIAKGNTIDFDLAEITTETEVIYSHNVIGWGIPVDINTRAERLRLFRGQRYNIAALIEIMRNYPRIARININNQHLEEEWGFVVISNTKYAGNNMRMAPLAKHDDGLLDVLLLRKVNRLKLIALFSKIFSGTHIPDHDIIYQQTENMQLFSDVKLPLIVDGEITGSTPFSVKILPGRIKIFK